MLEFVMGQYKREYGVTEIEQKMGVENANAENEIAPASSKIVSNTAQINPNRYIEAATAPNTRKAYRQDIRHFESTGALLPASPESILQYLQTHAESLNPKTLERRLIALRHWHVYQNFPDPTNNPLVKKTLKGIKNIHGHPRDKAPALSLATLAQIAKYLENQGTLSAIRDNAILQVGFFGAFRRSELIQICFEHLTEVSEGMEILIPRSKTDPEGKGQICALPLGNDTLCPVRALKRWIEAACINIGPLFRSINQWGQVSASKLSALAINLILKKAAIASGIPNAESYSAHSLRRGLATCASQQSAPIQSIMRQGRWRHQATVLGYIEEGHRFLDNAASILLKNKPYDMLN